MKTFTPPTYNKLAIADWLEYLETEGYVVIHDILTPQQISTAKQLFWKDWCTVSPGFDCNDTSTWSINTAPMMFAKGQAVFNGFGQSDFMWYLRTQPEIIALFEEIHTTRDLNCSFDGFSVFFSKQQKTKIWWHIDQHPDNEVYSVQGAYNFFPVTQESAGFTVVPRSHLEFDPGQVKGKKDWIMVHDPITKQGVKLLIPGNCFVLWNSRTIHSNIGLTHNDIRLDRLTAYITMLPKTTDKLSKRIEAYFNGDTCSHWANRVEIKRYPWGFGPRYLERGFGTLKPLPDEIPKEREQLI